METDLWGILKASQNQQNFVFFNPYCEPPSLVIPGFVLNGPWGISPYLPSWNSEVSSFQERPRLLAAAEDPEVPRYRLNWMNETNEAISHGILEVQHLKSMAKCWGTCHGMLGVSVFIWDHIIICAWSHGPFLQISQVPKWDWLDLTFLSGLFDSTNMSMGFLQTAIAFLLKMQVTDLSGQPLF